MVPVTGAPTMHLTDPAGLDARAVLAVARGELVPELGDGVTEVLACELLAVHQARRLTVGHLDASLLAAGLRAELDALTQDLPATVADRPFGRDVEKLRGRLGAQR